MQREEKVTENSKNDWILYKSEKEEFLFVQLNSVLKLI